LGEDIWGRCFVGLSFRNGLFCEKFFRGQSYLFILLRGALRDIHFKDSAFCDLLFRVSFGDILFRESFLQELLWNEPSLGEVGGA
ncbi:hypothetical protein, partial [Bartonella sp. DB5-6]|uniref:hypothetical protein n=1 Tax=Bartonella sp. DB5-6 TaxID=1094755 RepID=UPI00058B83AA